MRTNKSNIIFFLVVTLFLVSLFLPEIIDLIPSDEARLLVVIVGVLLVFIYIVFEAYDDLRKNQFTTIVYIVLADIIELVSFAVLVYSSFGSYDATNIEVLLKKTDIRVTAVLFLSGAALVRSFLKSQRFKKEV